jgi:hypothetical protein
LLDRFSSTKKQTTYNGDEECLYLVRHVNGKTVNMCGWYKCCERINDLNCKCPAIDNARKYEVALQDAMERRVTKTTTIKKEEPEKK